jgi:pyruvate,orthophosphate dikinase
MLDPLPTLHPGAFEEGDGKNKMLLGGKGANLCEMTQIGLNVPPGFVITTDACLAYLLAVPTLPKGVMDESWRNMKDLEKKTGKGFGGATIRCWCRCARARRCPCRA